MKTLVLALDSFGDQVLRQPLLSGLLDEGHDVTVVVRSGIERVLPLLDPRLRALPCPFEYTRAPALDTARGFLDGLASLEVDLLLSAQFDPVRYAGWIRGRLPAVRAAGFAGGREQEVAGARDLEPDLGLAAAPPLDVAIACEPGLPEAEKSARLFAGLTGREIGTRPRLSLPPACLDAGRQWLHRLGLEPGSYAVCCPAGTANVRIKAWPAWRFANLVSWMRRERGLAVLVMGHVSEASTVESASRLVGVTAPPAFLGRDEDFELMVSLLGLSRLYVGNDTGPMHLAAACGVPVVAVFGGGHWPRFLPMAETGAVHTQELACFGCGWDPCVFGDAPCVGEVPEEAVRDSVGRALDGERGFQVRAEPAIPEDQVRARPLQRLRQAAAGALAELDGLPELGSPQATRLRAQVRACDEIAGEVAARAERLRLERRALEARAEGQEATIGRQVAEIVRLDAVARRAPLVSIVTPARNAARLLERCILSVLGQDYGRVEHIVVDRGSTDGTLGICARYPHLVVCSAPDKSRAEALNRGFAMARGDVLAWLGADDEYLPRAVSIAVDTILEGHDAVVGLCQLVDDEGRRLGAHPGNPAGDVDHRALRGWRGAPLPEQALFWRRRLWERAGPLRQDPGGDPDFWLRLASLARIHRVGAELAACRVRTADPVPGAAGPRVGAPRSRLRIALFNARAVRSGSERFAARTAEALLARGHDVRLYVRDAMPEEERPHYLRLLPDPPLLRRAEASFRYRTGLNDLFFPTTALLRLQPWLSTADVWHFHNLHAHFVSLPALAAASWTKPILLSPLDRFLTTGYCTQALGCERFDAGCGSCPQVHTPYPGISRDSTRLLRRMKRASLRASRFHLLLHTRHLEDHHRAAFPGARIRRLALGVNVHTYRPIPRDEALRAVGLPDDGRFVAGAIASDVLDPRNGIPGAIEGLRSLAARHPGRIRVLVAGEGGRDVASLGDGNLDVRYVGYVKRDADMSMLLGCCDVLVHPGRSETLAFACLEALACGVPVVSYDCGAQREAVRDGANGLLVAPESPALMAAVERLIADPELRRRLARGARETAVREFDLDRYVDGLVGYYEELAGRLPAAAST